MIVAGFGFRSGADESSLTCALTQAAGQQSVALLATAGDKANAPVFRGFAAAQAKPVCAIDAARLQAQKVRTQSQASLAARGTGSLAEAAALAAAGPGARLLSPRVVSKDGRATCALAEGAGS